MSSERGGRAFSQAGLTTDELAVSIIGFVLRAALVMVVVCRCSARVDVTVRAIRLIWRGVDAASNSDSGMARETGV